MVARILIPSPFGDQILTQPSQWIQAIRWLIQHGHSLHHLKWFKLQIPLDL